MVPKDVVRIVLSCHDLPTLPEVVGRILGELESTTTSAGRLTMILESDHVITGRLLRLANSAFYGLERKVLSTQRAIVVLGYIAVRDLVLSTAVFDALNRKQQIALDPDDFWLHALGTARAAHLLARKYVPSASKEGCFTAGLLHDIGKYLMAIALRDEYVEIVQEAKSCRCSLREVEAVKIGTTHSEVGAQVIDEWKFPSLIHDIIESFGTWDSYSGPYREELNVVVLADEISRLAGFGNAGDCDETCLSPSLVRHYGLTSEITQEIVDEISRQRDEIVEFFNLLRK